MEKISIGKIVSAVALRGEVKIYSYSGSPERFADLKALLLPGPAGPDAARQRPARRGGPGRAALANASGRAAPANASGDRSGGFRPYEIESVRVQKNMAIVKLRGVDDRNAAEALRDTEVYITEDDLPPLPEDTYYVRDLEGCRVEDCETGQPIGAVRRVLQNTAQDIYVVELPDGRETMIPAVAEFVKDVDVAEKLIKVKLIPGFTDEAGVTVKE